MMVMYVDMYGKDMSEDFASDALVTGEEGNRHAISRESVQAELDQLGIKSKKDGLEPGKSLLWLDHLHTDRERGMRFSNPSVILNRSTLVLPYYYNISECVNGMSIKLMPTYNIIMDVHAYSFKYWRLGNKQKNHLLFILHFFFT